MTTTETISKLAGRDDLTQSEIIQLRDARRAAAGETERIVRGKWTIEINHSEHGWAANVWINGGGYYAGMRTLATLCQTREEAMEKVDAFFADAACVDEIEKRHGV